MLSTSTHDDGLRQEPVRTCVGCREHGLRSVLLRVIVAEDGGSKSVVPDPGRRLAGRGAWVHRDPTCLDAAERRRAFPRALRHPGPLDLAPLKAYFATECPQPAPSNVGSGSTADEQHPMSTR